MEALVFLMFFVIGLFVLVVCYFIVRSRDVLREMEENNAPYKLEPPESTGWVAVSENNNKKPAKRKYTKRIKQKAAKKKPSKARKSK